MQQRELTYDVLTTRDDELQRSSTYSFKMIRTAELIGLLRYYKWLVVGVVVGLMALSVVVIYNLTPDYMARTFVMIEKREGETNLVPLAEGLPWDSATITGETQVLMSRGLAEKVVKRLHLERSPEFNAALRKPTFLTSIANLFRSRDDKLLTEEERTRKQLQSVVDEFLSNHLAVAPVGISRVIEIEFTSEVPNVAAEGANTVAALYLHEQRKRKNDKAKLAHAWFQEQVKSLREELDVAETRVERFRQSSGLLQATNTTLLSQEISEINSQLILAKTAHTQAEARVRQAQQLADAPDDAASSKEVLASSIIQRLREQYDEVERKIAEAAAKYRPQHPTMVNLYAQKTGLQANIKTEINKIIQSLEHEVHIAQMLENGLENTLNDLKAQLATSNEKEVELRGLEREAQSIRTLLETFMARLKEATSQGSINSQSPDARVISRAEAPLKPDFPKKLPLIAVAFVASVSVAVLVVFMLELSELGFRRLEELESATGVPVLSLVPRIEGFERAETAASYLLRHPESAFGDSIQTLHNNLSLLSRSGPAKTLLVTSTITEEGATCIAALLAYSLKMAGRRVVMVDADLRRRKSASPGSDAPGLSDFLAAAASSKEIIHFGAVSGADIVPAGKLKPPNTAELLNSERMDEFLDELANDYEHIVITSPPWDAGPDACLMATKADATIIVIRWAYTRRELVYNTLRQLARVASRIGCVMSLVDLKRYASYAYMAQGGTGHSALHIMPTAWPRGRLSGGEEGPSGAPRVRDMR